MTNEDLLWIWRVVSDFSIEDAAIPMADGDPRAQDKEFDSLDAQSPSSGHWPPGFIAMSAALRTAVVEGKLPARVRYSANHSAYCPNGFEAMLGFSDPDLWRLIERADGVGHAESGKVYIEKEPDWGKTTAAVEDKKDWLRNQGWMRGFLFAGPFGEPEIESLQAVPETFMQFEHPHFAPELPLDVSAWRAFEEGHIFRRSSKAAITEWIERNHSAWKGKEPISQSAKERVATVVNWTPTGAAPRLD